MLATTLFVLATSAAAPQRHAHYYERLARTYFEVWNSHDVNGLLALFAPDVTLRDWDVHKTGAAAVAKANGNIFAAVPNIHIDVESVHVSEHTRTAACEILVRLNNANGEVLKVVDVIAFDDAGKISAVRAYKG